mmetsp:Transcript_41361/g.93177  ORF Transcript_41361/g.93177 Transcript_41361/m.93177 type:complete len:161 (+) Transcript_41361:159-641(+)
MSWVWEPFSTTAPSESTTIWSAFWTVPRRWAMTITVRFSPSLLSASWTPRSVTESRAEVASSRSTTGGFLSRHRAMATRCFSPPLSLRPRSPTTVSHPSGKFLMKSRIWAPRAASSRSAISASRRPYLMLCAMVSLKSTVSWGTTPIRPRSEAWVTPVAG